MTLTRMQQKWQVIKGSANVEVVAHSNYPLSSLSRFSVVRSNNLAVSTGLVHSELTVKLVGFTGHLNKFPIQHLTSYRQVFSNTVEYVAMCFIGIQ